MSKKKRAFPPVEPIGHILYGEQYGDRTSYPEMPAKFDRMCDCMGFSDDRPFSVFKSNTHDLYPYKVVFHWTNPNHKTRKVRRMGEDREEIDYNTYHMMDIIEQHATLSAAQKSMRKFAKEAFAKVNDAPTKDGDACHCVWTDDEGDEHKLFVGDLIEYTSCPGIVWRILGERRASDRWHLQVEPVLSFLVKTGTDKRKELESRDVYNYVRPLDLVELGVAYTKLGLLMQEEAKRRSG